MWQVKPGWTRSCLAALAASLLLTTPVAAQSARRAVRLGVVTDGPTERDAAIEQVFRQEIQGLLADEFDVSDRVIDGDWTSAGITRVFDRLLGDPEVDIVIAAGLTASSLAVQRRDLPKPVIAPYVVDGQLQGAPIDHGASGVHNLVYVTFPPTLGANLATFRELAGFTRFVLISPPLAAGTVDVIRRNVEEVAAELELGVTVVEAARSAEETLARIPADAEAVYLAPLFNLDDAAIHRLAEGLIERRLPSFSGWAGDAELGILATTATTQDQERLARRVAILLQRILLGEPPGSLPVSFQRKPELVINMATARAIGTYPSFALEAEARLLHPEREQLARVVSLEGVVSEAMSGNLDLRSFERTVAASRESVRESRARLLPRLDLSATGVAIDEDRGSFLQAQRTGVGSLGFSQILYSDRAWTSLEVQKQTAAAREQEQEQLRLDVTRAVASAYLNVLRAKTVERISRRNLALTRENLERAQTRVQVGVANRSEVFRWQSQLAENRASVIDAGATRNVAEIELNRILNRPLEEPFLTREVGLEDPVLIASDPRILRYMRDRWIFRVLRAFNVLEASANSPELRQLDAGIRAQERILTSSKRAFFVPDLALDASVDKRFYEGGAGSDVPRVFDRWDWQVAVQASIPLFTSGERGAARARAELELDGLRTDRRALSLRIEQRVRNALHRAGSSWAGIDLARQSAEAARRSLALVSDGYGRGALSIIDLLDAQNQAFVAELGAADALYRFLLDLVEAERAVGRFDFFSSPEEREAYFERLEAFARQRTPEGEP